MIPNLLIAFSEIQKLSLLYLAYDYGYRSALTLIFFWLIWGAVSTVVLGKLSDRKGRKFSLIITVSASILVSFLIQSKSTFLIGLLIDGLLVATLPIAFAAKSDDHPTRSKRLIYAEAFLARALPWFLIPMIYFCCGLIPAFWQIAITIASFLSAFTLIFFKDSQDAGCRVIHKKVDSESSIFKLFIFIFLISLFFLETSYQIVAYLVEEKESIKALTKSYILFGLGMSLTSAGHLLFKEIKGISFARICEILFIIVAAYFFIKFSTAQWFGDRSDFGFSDKTLLGIASGIYIPLIYAIVCEKFKIHQQGELCGYLESTMTIAEILSPAVALLIMNQGLSSNLSLLFISLGFFIAFSIIRIHQFFKGFS